MKRQENDCQEGTADASRYLFLSDISLFVRKVQLMQVDICIFLISLSLMPAIV